jgi:predicted membrane chloride channel (bestrophin family)
MVANAFVLPSQPATAAMTTRFAATLDESATKVTPKRRTTIKNIEYGEQSRKFRRTVYSHDDWRQHRQTDRFLYYLRAMFSSGVYKNLAREVTAATAIAAVLCLYNALVGGYVDFGGVQHDAIISNPSLAPAGLPLVPFSLCTSSLGLLLVFRTNTSYQRWDEARKNWGMNINHTRDLVRMASAYYDTKSVSDERRAADLNTLALCTWAFVRSMKRHLSPEDEDEMTFRVELYEKLPFDQARGIIEATHRPNRALQDLSLAIENLPMHYVRKHKIHQALTVFEDDLGSSERLLTSPVPLFYSRHTARFLSVWLLLLPFALYDACGGSWNHTAMIPIAAVISVFLFGIDEIATQLEEPFTILPMQAFCDKIYNWCMEIVSWQPGDNGMVIHAPLPEHMTMTVGETSMTSDAALKSAAVVAEEPAVDDSLETLNQPVTDKEALTAPSSKSEAPGGSASFSRELVRGEINADSISGVNDSTTGGAELESKSIAVAEAKVNSEEQQQKNPVEKKVDSPKTAATRSQEESSPSTTTYAGVKTMPTGGRGLKAVPALKAESQETVDKRQEIADRVARRRQMLKEMHNRAGTTVKAGSTTAPQAVVANVDDNENSKISDAEKGRIEATMEKGVISPDSRDAKTAQTTTKQADSPTAPEVVVVTDVENSNASYSAKTEEQAVSFDAEEAETDSITMGQAASLKASKVVVTETDEISKVSDNAKALIQDETEETMPYFLNDTTDQAASPAAPNAAITDVDEPSKVIDTAKTLNQDGASSSVLNEDKLDVGAAETAPTTTDEDGSPMAPNAVIPEIDENSKVIDTAKTLNQDEETSSASKQDNGVTEEAETAPITTDENGSPTVPIAVITEIDGSNSVIETAKTLNQDGDTSSVSKQDNSVAEEAWTDPITTDQADSPTASNAVVTEIDETSKSSDTAETLNQDEASSSVSKEGNSGAQKTKSDVLNDATKISKPKFLSQLKTTQPTFKDTTTDSAAATKEEESSAPTKPKFLSQLKPGTPLPKAGVRRFLKPDDIGLDRKPIDY